MTRAPLILKCFLSRNLELLFKAYFAYVRPLLEYCFSVRLTLSFWWLRWKVFKDASQNIYRECETNVTTTD